MINTVHEKMQQKYFKLQGPSKQHTGSKVQFKKKVCHITDDINNINTRSSSCTLNPNMGWTCVHKIITTCFHKKIHLKIYSAGHYFSTGWRPF